jgi:hypothetical protein
MFDGIALDKEKRPVKGEKAADKIRELLLGARRISQGDVDAENKIDSGAPRIPARLE